MDSAAEDRHWPEGGLPHGEHPYDYGYCDDEDRFDVGPEFDEWENAGRYLPGMLYPTLRPEERRRG